MKEIRRRNLRALIDEYTADDKMSDGEFAELITVDDEGKRMDPSYLSQLKNGHRGIGESTARNIEVSLNLPADWMDKNRADPNNDDEVRLLALYRLCDDRGKDAILSVAERQVGYSKK